MNHYSATSLNTNPAPIAPRHKVAVPETVLAQAMAIDANQSPVLRRQSSARCPSLSKSVASGVVERVRLALIKAGKPQTARELAAQVRCSAQTARIACGRLVDAGQMTEINGAAKTWRVRGPGDPQFDETNAPPKISKTVQKMLKAADSEPERELQQIERKILETLTGREMLSGDVAKSVGVANANMVVAHLKILRTQSYIDYITRDRSNNIRMWHRTAKPIPEVKADKPRLVAGIPVATATARNGARVSLSAFGGAADD